jgi:cytidine deaminase
LTKTELIRLAVKKANQSVAVYRISAIGLNKKGEVIYTAVNKHRFNRPGGGTHAEMIVMLKAGPGLKSILLCRIGNSGDLLPISPCVACARKAKELNIKIVSVKE